MRGWRHAGVTRSTTCPVAVPLPFGSLMWRGRCGYRGSARRWLAPPPAYSMSPVSRATATPATPLTAGRTANGRARPLWPSEPTPCEPWRMRGWRHAGVARSTTCPVAVPLPFGSLTWRGRCGHRGSARRWLAPPPAYSMSPVSRATATPTTRRWRKINNKSHEKKFQCILAAAPPRA